MQLLKHFTANNIRLSPYPFIRELSMEAYLIENESVLLLDNENFSDIEIIDVELSLKHGRKRKKTDGRIDILAVYNQQTYALIELKLGELNEMHLGQLEDYLLEKNQIVEETEIEDENSIEEEKKWIGVLVGSTIDSILEQKIKNGYLIHDSIPIVALTINRFRGEDNQVYVLTETHFKNISRNYDKTKYKFNNNILGKNRLVLEILRHYVGDNPNLTYSDLETVFPKRIQGTRYGVFGTMEEAVNIHENSGYRRHFLKSNEIIILSDKTKIAICSQWGIGNIDVFIRKAQDLGYQIQILEQQ